MNYGSMQGSEETVSAWRPNLEVITPSEEGLHCRRNNERLGRELDQLIKNATDNDESTKTALMTLIKDGASLIHQNEIGLTPIEFAAELGKWNLVKTILEKAKNASKNDPEHYSYALIRAVRAKQWEIVIALSRAKAGMRVHSIDTHEFALHYLMRHADDNDENAKAALRVLIIKGAKLKDRNSQEQTPIQVAAKLGKWTLIRAAINEQRASEVDAEHYGYALIKAVEAEKWEIAAELAQRGAKKLVYPKRSPIPGTFFFCEAFLSLIQKQTNPEAAYRLRLLKELYTKIKNCYQLIKVTRDPLTINSCLEQTTDFTNLAKFADKVEKPEFHNAHTRLSLYFDKLYRHLQNPKIAELAQINREVVQNLENHGIAKNIKTFLQELLRREICNLDARKPAMEEFLAIAGCGLASEEINIQQKILERTRILLNIAKKFQIPELEGASLVTDLACLLDCIANEQIELEALRKIGEKNYAFTSAMHYRNFHMLQLEYAMSPPFPSFAPAVSRLLEAIKNKLINIITHPAETDEVLKKIASHYNLCKSIFSLYENLKRLNNTNIAIRLEELSQLIITKITEIISDLQGAKTHSPESLIADFIADWQKIREKIPETRPQVPFCVWICCAGSPLAPEHDPYDIRKYLADINLSGGNFSP